MATQDLASAILLEAQWSPSGVVEHASAVFEVRLPCPSALYSCFARIYMYVCVHEPHIIIYEWVSNYANVETLSKVTKD